MPRIRSGVLVALICLTACGTPANEETATGGAEDIQAQAQRLGQELLIVDTHVDAPYRQEDERIDLAVATDRDFDYPKAKAGGLDVPFMSIYIPATYQETGGATELADRLIDMVEEMAATASDKFQVVTSAADAQAAFDSGRIGFAMGMENGEPIDGDLDNLRHFYERGIRYVGLAHSENNHLSDSSYADEPEWNGLSPFGHEVIVEMNRLGIMIDLSHLTDAAAEQILQMSRAPVIASHSSCRAMTPDWERNISDELIAAVGDNGGVVMINFGSAFLNAAANAQSTDFWEKSTLFAEENELDSDSPEIKEFAASYWQENEKIFATIDDVADHIDHVVELGGIDHVGLGSDFDGVGDSLPAGLKDASGYPNLFAELLERGYSEDDIAKIAGGNLLRVWREVENAAAAAAG